MNAIINPNLAFFLFVVVISLVLFKVLQYFWVSGFSSTLKYILEESAVL